MKQLFILLISFLLISGCSNIQKLNGTGYFILKDGRKINCSEFYILYYSNPHLIRGDYMFKEHEINGQINEIHLVFKENTQD